MTDVYYTFKSGSGWAVAVIYANPVSQTGQGTVWLDGLVQGQANLLRDLMNAHVGATTS